MSEQFRKSSELAAANFDHFIEGRTDQIKVKVFLCGRALMSDRSIQEQADLDIRAFLLVRLEQEIGCRVFLGEHNELIKSYRRANGITPPTDADLRTVNLTLFEANLADYVDLVVIFPDSPGSFAELGMFSVAPGICTKLLLIIDQQYEGASSFIIRGPVLAAKNNRAQVEYLAYDNREGILQSVRSEILRIRETLAAQDIWQRKSHR